MIYVFGVEPFDYSQSSKMLLRELKRAGFRRSELEVINDEQFPDEGHVLCFGSEAFKEITASDSTLGDSRGQLHCAHWNTNLLVYPTYSPGYLYRNRNTLPLFRGDLENAYVWIKFDHEGIVC